MPSRPCLWMRVFDSRPRLSKTQNVSNDRVVSAGGRNTVRSHEAAVSIYQAQASRVKWCLGRVPCIHAPATAWLRQAFINPIRHSVSVTRRYLCPCTYPQNLRRPWLAVADPHRISKGSFHAYQDETIGGVLGSEFGEDRFDANFCLCQCRQIALGACTALDALLHALTGRIAYCPGTRDPT